MATYTAINAYKWGDEDKAVKVYIDLEGIASHPKEKIEVEFKANSFDLKVNDFNGRNLRLALGDLNDELDEAKCSYRTSAKRIVLSLAKKSEKKWWDLQKKAPAKFNPED
eukprot:m51a1_g11307 putative sgs domain-containing protein (110) ;mRNA; f:81288-81703